MPAKKYTKEEIVRILQNLANNLKKNTLTTKEIATVISTSTVKNYFGSIGTAVEAAGLKKRKSWEHLNHNEKYSDEDLFRSILVLENELGEEPGQRAYSANGRYSVQPFRKRFGKWSDVLAHYRKWKAEGGATGVPASESARHADPPKSEPSVSITQKIKSDKPMLFYGEPIDFRGFRHAPINELGVVYLFGMVSKELGFYIESIQAGFPDCEGKFLYNPKKNLWAKARIEFEFKASNFREHGHDPNQCDFIVCWENDWPDSPVTVIELKTEILKLKR